MFYPARSRQDYHKHHPLFQVSQTIPLPMALNALPTRLPTTWCTLQATVCRISLNHLFLPTRQEGIATSSMKLPSIHRAHSHALVLSHTIDANRVLLVSLPHLSY